MHRDKRISRRNGNSKQLEFRAAEREGVYQDEDVEIRTPLEMVRWNKPPLGDVKYQDKTHQT